MKTSSIIYKNANPVTYSVDIGSLPRRSLFKQAFLSTIKVVYMISVAFSLIMFSGLFLNIMSIVLMFVDGPPLLLLYAFLGLFIGLFLLNLSTQFVAHRSYNQTRMHNLGT